jgi:uncharacterized GH25 family protein
MNRLHIRSNLTLIVAIAVLLLLASSPGGIAQQTTSTFSGRVVDVKGNPVTGFSFTIYPTKLINGHAITMMSFSIPSSAIHKTDDEGHFLITAVMPGPVQLIEFSPMLQQSQKNYEILSMKIGKMTFYPTAPSHDKGIKFAIEPGTHLENVKITVRPRTRYRGQVVSKDGIPLRNAKIELDVQRKDKTVRSQMADSATHFSTRMKITARTDFDGYFVRHVDEPDFETAFYTVSVKCQGLSATSEFTLKSGEQREDLVFTLEGTRMAMRGQIVFDDGTPLPNAMFKFKVHSDTLDKNSPRHPSRRPVTDDEGYFIEYLYQPGSYIASVEYQGLLAMEKFTVKDGKEREELIFTLKELIFTLNDTPIFDMMGMMAPTVPNSLGVWVGPPNGHSYKSIRCNSWKDAQTKARKEGAQLVSINDRAEQEWLVEQFGFLPYWIGLTYSVETGEWKWSSGEPVTYTNWAEGQPEHIDAKSYGSINGDLRGSWRVLRLLGAGMSGKDTPRAAILEKK